MKADRKATAPGMCEPEVAGAPGGEQRRRHFMLMGHKAGGGWEDQGKLPGGGGF